MLLLLLNFRQEPLRSLGDVLMVRAKLVAFERMAELPPEYPRRWSVSSRQVECSSPTRLYTFWRDGHRLGGFSCVFPGRPEDRSLDRDNLVRRLVSLRNQLYPKVERWVSEGTAFEEARSYAHSAYSESAKCAASAADGITRSLISVDGVCGKPNLVMVQYRDQAKLNALSYHPVRLLWTEEDAAAPPPPLASR